MMRKQKIKIDTPKMELTDEDNEFLDDFLKPPLKLKDQPSKNHSNIRLQHYSTPNKLNKNKSSKLQSLQVADGNKHIKQILKNIKRQQSLRREKTLKLLKQVAQEKQEEKKLHQFRIAERRIRKRLMLIQRKERLQQQLLSFVHNDKFEDSIPDKVLKQKSKSVDDATQTTTNHQIHKRNPNKDQKYHDVSRTSAIRERVQFKQSQVYLPQIKNGSDILKRNKVSAITLTKELRIQQQEVEKPKRRGKNYFSQLRRRNYTEANELTKIFNEGQASLQKTQRAVELATKLQNSRRLKMKNINQVDYKQAQRKIQLLNLIHKAHEK